MALRGRKKTSDQASDASDVEVLKKQISELEAQLAAANKATAEAKAAAEKKVPAESSIESQLRKRAETAEKQVRELQAQVQKFQLEKAKADWEAKHPEVAAPKFLAVHELAADETLSHLALKYYGHATPTYWKLIYEVNKDQIGDNPNKVRPGSLINIPELPEEMKDK